MPWTTVPLTVCHSDAKLKAHLNRLMDAIQAKQVIEKAIEAKIRGLERRTQNLTATLAVLFEGRQQDADAAMQSACEPDDATHR